MFNQARCKHRGTVFENNMKDPIGFINNDINVMVTYPYGEFFISSMMRVIRNSRRFSAFLAPSRPSLFCVTGLDAVSSLSSKAQ